MEAWDVRPHRKSAIVGRFEAVAPSAGLSQIRPIGLRALYRNADRTGAITLRLGPNDRKADHDAQMLGVEARRLR
jgi:hypothetical protein